ncbi:MAG: hypothetical protein GXO66_10460 [Euryarchaeota archaeon]|nr:hypothetical protein [Euryarchaeota archaeon]
MRTESLLGGAGVVLILLGLLVPLSTGSTSTGAYRVPAGGLLELRLELEHRERVVGFFSVRGNPPEIGFSVLSPEGSRVAYSLEPPSNFVAPGVVAHRHNFNFIAGEEGSYTLLFNNTAYASDKQVTLKLARIPAQLGIHPTNLLILLGFALIFLRYFVDDLLERRYREVAAGDFEHLGGGVFVLKSDRRVRIRLGERPSQLEEELRSFGLKPRNRFSLYHSLRKMAEEVKFYRRRGEV